MQVCTCTFPQVRKAENGKDDYCKSCGRYYSPEHGSLTPADTATVLALATRQKRKPERNHPCNCGSGKKFKKCCGAAGGSPVDLILKAGEYPAPTPPRHIWGPEGVV